jgi:hypothetical protein
MNEAVIYNELESLRDLYLENNDGSLGVSEVAISGEFFEKRVWVELHENSKLVVFLLESKTLVTSKAYCLGLLISESGAVRKMSNEDLWGIGIP